MQGVSINYKVITSFKFTFCVLILKLNPKLNPKAYQIGYDGK